MQFYSSLVGLLGDAESFPTVQDIATSRHMKLYLINLREVILK